jgi:hypothetical protein
VILRERICKVKDIKIINYVALRWKEAGQEN